MEKKSLIYVAGHTGLVGSALVRVLRQKGYERILSRTREELDLTVQKDVEVFFQREKPDYVFICAGKTGGISANTNYPGEFIYRNAAIAVNLIFFSHLYNVKKLIYLGCSCMYPKFTPQPVKEEYLLAGAIEPTNRPYAVAKILGVELCLSYNRQYKTHFIPVIAGNIYGPGFSCHGEDAHVIPALIRKMNDAGKKKADKVSVWGSGKPERDFIYVDDIADAAVFLMENRTGCEIINVGTGRGVSIARLASDIKSITGFKGEIIYDKSKPDGIPSRVLDVTKLTKLGWKHSVGIERGLKLTWEWFKEKHGGC